MTCLSSAWFFFFSRGFRFSTLRPLLPARSCCTPDLFPRVERNGLTDDGISKTFCFLFCFHCCLSAKKRASVLGATSVFFSSFFRSYGVFIAVKSVQLLCFFSFSFFCVDKKKKKKMARARIASIALL